MIAAITQVRVLGGVIGVAICQLILTNHVNSKLAGVLDPQQIKSLLLSPNEASRLSPNQAIAVQEAYGSGFNLQSRTMLFLAIASLVVSLAAFKRHPKHMKDLAEDELELRKADTVPNSIASPPSKSLRSFADVNASHVSMDNTYEMHVREMM